MKVFILFIGVIIVLYAHIFILEKIFIKEKIKNTEDEKVLYVALVFISAFLEFLEFLMFGHLLKL